MSYTKLESSILTSTVWAECDTTRIVWITMLALADKDGYVAASVPGLAHVARVDRGAVDKAIGTLSSPDADSRNKDFDGRRIQACEGGWMLLSYPRIRDGHSAEERREYNRQWMVDYRAKSKSVDSVDNPQVHKSPQNPPVDEMDTPTPTPTPEKNKSIGNARTAKRRVSLPADFSLTEERIEYAHSKGLTDPKAEFEKFRLHHTAHGKVMSDWDAAWRTWVLNARRFGADAGDAHASARRRMFEGAV